jgi:hypothetical protein
MEPSSQSTTPKNSGSNRTARLGPIDWIKRRPWTTVRIAVLVILPVVVYFQTIAAMTEPPPHSTSNPPHVPAIDRITYVNQWDFGYRHFSLPGMHPCISIGPMRLWLK